MQSVPPRGGPLEADRRWQEVINDLFPIEITHFEINDGELRFVDSKAEPHVDVAIKNLRVHAVGLRNRRGGKTGLFSTLAGRCGPGGPIGRHACGLA